MYGCLHYRAELCVRTALRGRYCVCFAAFVCKHNKETLLLCLNRPMTVPTHSTEGATFDPATAKLRTTVFKATEDRGYERRTHGLSGRDIC